MIIQRNSMPTHRNSTPTHRNSTAIYRTSTYGNPRQISASPQAAFQFRQSNLWHSGLSPHPCELIVLPNNVRVCYGCGSPFKAEERSSLNNVVIRNFDRRFRKFSFRGGKLLPIHSLKWNRNDVLTTCKAITLDIVSGLLYCA